MIGDVQTGRSLSELINRLKEWKDKQLMQERDGQAPPVYAYALDRSLKRKSLISLHSITRYQ